MNFRTFASHVACEVAGSLHPVVALAAFSPRHCCALHTGHTAPYALCVTLFNVFRRLKLGAYCVVIRGIPAHSEGILMGHEVAKSQVVNQTHTTSLTELHLDLIK